MREREGKRRGGGVAEGEGERRGEPWRGKWGDGEMRRGQEGGGVGDFCWDCKRVGVARGEREILTDSREGQII